MTSNSPMKLQHPGDPERTDNGSVIVVDDEPQVRALFRTFLEIAGYKVSEAHCAQALPEIRITSTGIPAASGLRMFPSKERLINRLRALMVRHCVLFTHLRRG
jgi:CheY-like chemotaxis protein